MISETRTGISSAAAAAATISSESSSTPNETNDRDVVSNEKSNTPPPNKDPAIPDKERRKAQILQKEKRIIELKALLKEEEKQLLELQGHHWLYLLLLRHRSAILVALLAWSTLRTYRWYDDNKSILTDFFGGRREYLFMYNMTTTTKKLLVNLPFLANDARDALRANMDSHESIMEFYDPTRHNNVYRSLKTNVLTREECTQIRNLIERHTLGTTYDSEVDGMSLSQEFQAVPVTSLLELDGYSDGESNISTPEEIRLVADVMKRVQKTIEETFNSSTIILEFADITRRRNPIPKRWSNILRRLHYLSTGGHGHHADQCSLLDETFGTTEGFICEPRTDACCPHRTHSALLYLNDPEESDLVGGDFFMINRHDLFAESESSYEGLGILKLLGHTLRAQPKCGNLMMFTSDARNIHGTFPIVDGSRYAMPMWFSDPTQLPWHAPDAVHSHLDYFMDKLFKECPFMGLDVGIPVPTALVPFVGDCDGMFREVERLIFGEEIEFQEEEEEFHENGEYDKNGEYNMEEDYVEEVDKDWVDEEEAEDMHLDQENEDNIV